MYVYLREYAIRQLTRRGLRWSFPAYSAYNSDDLFINIIINCNVRNHSLFVYDRSSTYELCKFE